MVAKSNTDVKSDTSENFISRLTSTMRTVGVAANAAGVMTFLVSCIVRRYKHVPKAETYAGIGDKVAQFFWAQYAALSGAANLIDDTTATEPQDHKAPALVRYPLNILSMTLGSAAMATLPMKVAPILPKLPLPYAPKTPRELSLYVLMTNGTEKFSNECFGQELTWIDMLRILGIGFNVGGIAFSYGNRRLTSPLNPWQANAPFIGWGLAGTGNSVSQLGDSSHTLSFNEKIFFATTGVSGILPLVLTGIGVAAGTRSQAAFSLNCLACSASLVALGAYPLHRTVSATIREAKPALSDRASEKTWMDYVKTENPFTLSSLLFMHADATSTHVEKLAKRQKERELIIPPV